MIGGKLIRWFRQAPVSVAWICAIAGGALALYHLRDFSWPHDFHSSLSALIQLAPRTGRAAIKLWIFWAWSGVLIAALLRRIEPQLDAFDACLAGAAGVWVLGYLMGSILGPLGLFRGTTVWLLMGVATVFLFRSIPLDEICPPKFGAGLVLVAIALAAVSLIPLQLTSPVVPCMDALCWPAAVQRILTFHVYLPFDNDPFGWWAPPVQTPGTELFYAFLGLGSNINLGALAESAAIMPMAALTVVAAYRYAVSLFDNAAGGAAALLLFLTTIFRRMTSMRGSAVDLALVAVGLAFFLSPSRSRVLIAMGALMLGTAVPSHVLNGAFGIGVAIAAVFAFLIEGDFNRARAGATCVIGAIALSVPEFAIATRFVLPGAVLILFELAGIALAIAGAMLLNPEGGAMEPAVSRLTTTLIARLLLGGVTVAILYSVVKSPGAIYDEIRSNFPLLSCFALAGIVAMLTSVRRASALTIVVTAAMVSPALVVEHSGWLLARLAHNVAGSFETFDLNRKIAEYWLPFVLVFPAAAFFATLFEYLSRSVVIVAMLAMLLYPPVRAPGMDYDYQEHSIPESWMVDYTRISQGYWYLTPDSRWTIGPTERQLVRILFGEIAAGRINPSTHILHLTNNLLVFGPTSRFSMYTGIDDDTVTFQPTADNWDPFLQGSRVLPMVRLPEALARHPDYIVTQTQAPPSVKLPPPGYQTLLDLNGFALYRRIGIRASSAPGSIFPNWIDLLVAFLIGAGAALAIRRLQALRHEPSTA